jgi:hypothetical protein
MEKNNSRNKYIAEKYAYTGLTDSDIEKLHQGQISLQGKIKTLSPLDDFGVIDAFDIDWKDSNILFKGEPVTSTGGLINMIEKSITAEKTDVEYALTHVHYILRKIYSLIIKKHIKETTETFSFHLIGTDPSTGESVNMNESHTCYTDSWEITGFMIDEFKKIGTADVSIYGFEVVRGTNTNNNGRILFSIENDDIEAGKVYNFSDFDTEPVKIVPEADNEFTGILYYKKASQDEAIYNPDNYDSSISTLLENPWITDTTKIHVSVPLNQYVEPLKPRYFFCYIPAEYNQPEAEFSEYMVNENENVEYFISNIEPIVKVASTSTTYPKNTTFNIKKDGFIYCIKPYDSKVPMYAINDTGAYTMKEISKMNYNINGEEIPYVLYRSTYALDTTNIDINVKFK